MVLLYTVVIVKFFFNELCHMQIPNVILFDNKY